MVSETLERDVMLRLANLLGDVLTLQPRFITAQVNDHTGHGDIETVQVAKVEGVVIGHFCMRKSLEKSRI